MDTALIGAAMIAVAAVIVWVLKPRGGKSRRFMTSHDVVAAVALVTTILGMGGCGLIVSSIAD